MKKSRQTKRFFPNADDLAIMVWLSGNELPKSYLTLEDESIVRMRYEMGYGITQSAELLKSDKQLVHSKLKRIRKLMIRLMTLPRSEILYSLDKKIPC